MTYLCLFCHKIFKVTPGDPGLVSHGACDACHAIQMAELKLVVSQLSAQPEKTIINVNSGGRG